ncbi:BadF/BadG/BcrA/BcrD ATPase family protein [Chelatococcus sp. SYSU_G07232]|uniref:BadF/BadG/BcrA/BcrD ATPase family protein n=1 Tax=Chelatococcus albus TaxID=3047466 RepID=A0ABT7AFN4_9HYPH|nr:BadF/BadG/BcrA/BcrD ATPase family protein [Chelatococcus sp. SYSU_G07232]MDJ1158172.1 BadF/BadG/BcrA/BcrD ATPase family protein [Chelatococcus sp. SYSU_G07232]
MSEALFIGVDGGGTQCRARLRDAQGRALGEGLGGPANARLDPTLVMKSILTACRAAAAAAGLGEEGLRRAHAGLGLAGGGQRKAVARLLAEPHPFASVAVETDAYATWLGAFRGEDGAILIVGTGSCGLAVVGGVQTYVSGWGAEISDEGSGLAIGREAIRRALWAYDGRAPRTPLADVLLRAFDNDPETIIDWAKEARPADFARFVPQVFAYAEMRDPLGLALIGQAASDVARIGERLLDAGAPGICLIGGLAEPLRPWLPPPLQAKLVAAASDAMDGAILLARRACGTPAPVVKERA